MYSSVPDDKIFQKKPPCSKPSAHPLKSWTETIDGYLNNAKQLTTCLYLNRKLAKQSYTWFVTIYVDVVMQPKEVNDWWKKAGRNLERKGVVAFWVREPTRTNKVHYHLLLRSQHTKAQLAAIIEESLPNRQLGRWHKNIKPIAGSDWRVLHYISKAKTPGLTRQGKYVTDLYAKKRLLFKSGLGFRKLGVINKTFWVMSREAIWKSVQDKEKKIAEGLEKPNVKRLCGYVYDFLDGYVPLKKIERSYGFWSDSEGVQNWIDSLLTDEWAEEDAADNG